MSITQKEYCGHWTPDELTRTLVLKLRQIDRVRMQLRDLETETLFIQHEQRERLAVHDPAPRG